jgi:hypothetical protein
MNKTLTQEELQQVQDIRKQALELASALGELGYQQVLIDLDKANLTEAVKDLKQKERTLLDEFNKKYGDGVINLETGEIQPRS